MRTLATFAAIVGFSVFGWTGVADADPLSDKGEVSCNRTLNPEGILDDEYTVMWKDVDAAYYWVSLICMDMKGSASGQRVLVDDDDATNTHVFTIGNSLVPESLQEGWGCHAWSKPYANGDANNDKDQIVGIAGHDACDFPLTD